MKLVDAPWDAMVLYPDEPQFRQAFFGVYGLMSFHVHEESQTIRIFNVVWTG